MRYFDQLHSIFKKTKITGNDGKPWTTDFSIACDYVQFELVLARNTGSKVLCIGNGGSAAIASHVAVDLQKRCNIPALTFNDPSMFTCYANDCGYDRVYSAQLAHHIKQYDLLIAISSSGRSPNIIEAAKEGLKKNCQLITFTGFDPDNDLRQLGWINFYIPSYEYGFVELSHQIILHSICDAIVREIK